MGMVSLYPHHLSSKRVTSHDILHINIPQISYFHINSHIIPRFSPVMGPRGYKALPISLRIDILHRTILVVLSVKPCAMVGVRTAMLYIAIKPSTIET